MGFCGGLHFFKMQHVVYFVKAVVLSNPKSELVLSIRFGLTEKVLSLSYVLIFLLMFFLSCQIKPDGKAAFLWPRNCIFVFPAILTFNAIYQDTMDETRLYYLLSYLGGIAFYYLFNYVKR